MKKLLASLTTFFSKNASILISIVASSLLTGFLMIAFFLDVKTVNFFLINMLYAIAAIYCLFVALRIRDLRLKIKFKKDVWPILKKDSIAMAVWLAAWIIAGGMVIAAGLSG